MGFEWHWVEARGVASRCRSAKEWLDSRWHRAVCDQRGRNDRGRGKRQLGKRSTRRRSGVRVEARVWIEVAGSGIDDVLELEAKVTALALRFPAVVVCMYDVNTVPGRLILKGGFQTHPWAVCGDHLQPNPYYVPEAEFLRQLHHAP